MRTQLAFHAQSYLDRLFTHTSQPRHRPMKVAEKNLRTRSEKSAPPAIGEASIHFNAEKGWSIEVSYGWIDAGEAIIEITEEKKSIAGRDVMHVVGKGNSMGTFNWFFQSTRHLRNLP